MKKIRKDESLRKTTKYKNVCEKENFFKTESKLKKENKKDIKLKTQKPLIVRNVILVLHPNLVA